MIITATPETPKLAKIEVDTDVMITKHNFPCPICLHRHAILNLENGIFSPCWNCQRKGWNIKKKEPSYLFQESPTSFGDYVILPRWKSILCDMLCFFSFGIYKPKRKEGYKCLGDIPN